MNHNKIWMLLMVVVMAMAFTTHNHVIAAVQFSVGLISFMMHFWKEIKKP